MYIKQVRIAGFKSFVDPLEIPFEEGLTGVVGPNGCGKSNLLEAMRWAMGANSAKAMRGTEMDDMIFSGTNERPAREIAEVTLALDNAERTAPPQFNETDTLEVLRQITRGEGSVYKINNRTVRGKDIRILFADASTGANSPSLVRQGQISELIGAKPANRRRILEEAAGISGLNARRHEAELKLNQAQSNLERLSDIAEEIERQYRSLKRQARKASQYKELSNQIAGLEAWVAHLKWIAAEEECKNAQSKMEESKTLVTETTLAAAKAETYRIETNEELTPLREAETVVASKLGQIRIALAKVETERQANSQTIDRLEREKNRITKDIETEISTHSENLKALQVAQNSLDTLPSLPLDDSEQGLVAENKAKKKLDLALKNLEKAQTEHDRLRTQLAENQAKRESLTAAAEAQSIKKKKLATEKTQLELELSDLDSIEYFKAEIAKTQKRIDNLNSEIETFQTSENELESAFAKAKEIEELADEPLEEAIQQLRTLEAERAGLERLLYRSDESEVNPVIDSIQVLDGYEKALGVALGDDLEASLDENSNIYWVGTLEFKQSLPEGAEPLINFVKAPKQLNARLLQCGVVENKSEGEKLANSLGLGQRVVSKDGHLWRWDGFVRTPDAPAVTTERLLHMTRRETIDTELKKWTQTRDTALQTYEKAKTDRSKIEFDLIEARGQLSSLKHNLSVAQSANDKISRAFDVESVRREAITKNLQRVEHDFGEVTEILSMSAQIDIEQVEQLKQKTDRAFEILQNCRRSESEARNILTDITRSRTQLAERKKALELEIDNWNMRLSKNDQRINELKIALEQSENELNAFEKNSEELNQRHFTLANQVEEVENERKVAADKFAAKSSQAREADTNARKATRDDAEAREALASATARFESATQKLEDTVESTRNSFQCEMGVLKQRALNLLNESIIEIQDLNEIERIAEENRRKRDALGGVNMDAAIEAEELSKQIGVQESEKADLVAAIRKLREAVETLNVEGRERLLNAFEVVNEHFKSLFEALFEGGEAELRLVDADDPLAAGLEILAQPPGKRLVTLNLMSGGEQALTATALIFAVFLSRPAPICVLDEVDAPLDDTNVDRFCTLLDEMRKRTNTRFMIITHNAVTMSRMDRLFGVTMREKGVSQLVSVDLESATRLAGI